MTKTILYTYLGTNGTITSQVHLEDIYYIRKVQLKPDAGKMLTRDNKNYTLSIIIPEDEVNEWKEIKVEND